MINIAVIGSNWFIKKFKQSVIKDWGIHFMYYPYGNFAEAPSIVKQISSVDVLLFAGSFPYELSKPLFEESNVPALYVRQDVNSLSLSLIKALLNGYTLDNISIDYRHQEEWDSLVRELDGRVPVHAFPIDHLSTTEQVIELHEKNLTNASVRLVITSVHLVAEHLADKGVTTQRAVDSENSITKMIDDAVQVATFHQLSDAQIAVGLISTKSVVDQDFGKIAHLLDAVLQQEDEMAKLYTTVGKLRRFLTSELLQQWMSELSEYCAIGFGSGETLLKAEQHAKAAYHYKINQQQQKKVFYYVDLNNRLTGPYPESTEVLDLSVTNEQLLTLSQSSGLSPVNVSKLIQFDQLNKDIAFTIDDLALYLQVTRRTAERLIKKLSGTPYLALVGEQSKGGKGRPKSMYRLQFDQKKL